MCLLQRVLATCEQRAEPQRNRGEDEPARQSVSVAFTRAVAKRGTVGNPADDHRPDDLARSEDDGERADASGPIVS